MTLHSRTQVVENASTAFFIFPSFNITSYKVYTAYMQIYDSYKKRLFHDF
ncbi:hypothetical protein C1A50_2285 [Paenibacillus polymyxa]|nr:hypothetical protein C1A50_2285 [Paenibacillus polymyxa]